MPGEQAPEPSGRPDPAEAEKTILAAFTRWVETEHGLDLPDYDALWRWSVDHLEDFWRGLAVLRRPLRPRAGPGAGQLGDARSPVVALTEAGESREVTWAELEGQVTAAAATLRRLGVGLGDTVAGYLPNGAEAIVAFLATVSLGAVWSGCGPDYAAAAAANRLAQLEPKVLVAADGYHFAGRTHDRRDEAVQLAGLLPTLTDVLHVRHLGVPPPPYASAVTEWADAAEPGPDAPGPGRGLKPEAGSFGHPLWVLYSSG